LTEGEDDGEQLLSCLVQLAVRLEIKVDINQVCSSEELYCVSCYCFVSVCKYLTWNTMPEEMIGVVPNSINVPLLLANIIRSQYIGSEVSEETMP
jgi:hypothetical protein